VLDRVERDIWIAADPATVFAYFTDGSRIPEWMGIGAVADPIPGGAFCIEMTPVTRIRGRYVEIEAARRIVMTWEWEGDSFAAPAGTSTVEIDLRAHQNGTLVQVVHRDITPERRDRHDLGWQHYLSRLARAACGQDPGRDTWSALVKE
jgi:uncharacterized protein YndB with AHSA1/START domain